MELSPAGVEQRRQRLLDAHVQSARRVAALRMPMFGLPPAWSGVRCLGACTVEQGAGTRRDGSGMTTFRHSVELGHESTDGASYLAVQTADVFATIAASALVSALADLAAVRARGRTGRGDCGDRAGRAVPGPREVAVTELVVRLDGRPTAFAAARWRDLVVARWPGHAVTVTVRAEAWPGLAGLELVRILDPRPYLDGRRRRLEQASGIRLG